MYIYIYIYITYIYQALGAKLSIYLSYTQKSSIIESVLIRNRHSNVQQKRRMTNHEQKA